MKSLLKLKCSIKVYSSEFIKAGKSSECYLQTQANYIAWPLQNCTWWNCKVRGQIGHYMLKGVFAPPP